MLVSNKDVDKALNASCLGFKMTLDREKFTAHLLASRHQEFDPAIMADTEVTVAFA